VGVTLSGADAGNYSFGGFTTATPNYVVDKRNTTVSGSRMYDATNAAPGADLTAVNALISGDSVTVVGSGSVSDAYVANNKTISGLGTLSLAGSDAGNYNLLTVGNALTITPDPNNFRWAASTGGNWDAASNWNQGVVPVVGAVVTIPDIGAPGLSENITYRSVSGGTYLKSINSQEGLTVNGGVLTVGATTADLSFLPLITLSGGAFSAAGTVNVANLNLSSGGRLEGVGRIAGNVNNTAGVVAPGNSAGILTIEGDYAQGASGSLAVEIGGAAAGTQYDRLVVTGNVSLGGALDVELVNGFIPPAGSAFSVIQAGGAITGVFSPINVPVTPIITPIYSASSFNLATNASGSLNTEQLVAVQVDQANNSAPSTNINLEAGVINTSGSGGIGGVYLETGSGQIVALTPTASAPAGLYTNVATGETTVIGSGNLPDPGIYLSSDGKTIVAITTDQETGQIVTMTGTGSKSDFDVGTKTQVKKPGVCS